MTGAEGFRRMPVVCYLGACRAYEFRLQIRRSRPKSSPVFVKYTQYSPQTGENLASILQIFASKS